MERKVVFVTGASTGIGKAISQYLISKDHIVYGSSRNVSHGDVLDGITMVKLDMANVQSIESSVEYILGKEGRIDVLVNNAGTGLSGAVEDTSPEEASAYLKSHIVGLIACCQAVIPTMRKAGSGKIINISSIAGEFGLPFRGIYSAGKSALNRITESLRMELAPSNISVSMIRPGDFSTNINQSRIIPKKSLSEDSYYYTAFKKQYERISSEVSVGENPEQIGRLVSKIIKSKNPKLRYTAGGFVHKLSILLNTILPSGVFQKMLSKRYPVK